MKNLINRALDFIFPPICGICGKYVHEFLCEECKNRLGLIAKAEFRENQDLVEIYKAHFWLFQYDDIRELMLKYKFYDQSYLYITISELILNNEKAKEILNRADYIIPVPIHKKRRYERGYNQCELIAKRLADKINNLKYKPDILGKRKNIVPQSTLNKDKRIDNIKDAFYIRNQIDLKNKITILFDDIYTTGSTVLECAKVLKTLNSKCIYIFTIAKK